MATKTPAKRPRIDPTIAALIDRSRGGMPFEQYVNQVLGEHVSRLRGVPAELAKIAARESGMTLAERRRLYRKIDANATDTSKSLRHGFTPEDEHAFDAFSLHLPRRNHEDAETYRALFWGHAV